VSAPANHECTVPTCDGFMYPRQSSPFYACNTCGAIAGVTAPAYVPPKPKPKPKVVDDSPTLVVDLSDLVPASELVAGDSPDDDDELSGLVVPDFTEVMIGWRAWGVPASWTPGEVPLLHSVTHGDYVWTPREVVEAHCPKAKFGKGSGHGDPPTVPGENCTCGFYSAKTRDHLQSMSYHKYDAERSGMFHVMGEVALWGKVVEGTQGWRAQFGYPRKLYVPFEAHKLVAPLKDAYGCEVVLNNILRKTDAA
jgi:hypothetical protein